MRIGSIALSLGLCVTLLSAPIAEAASLSDGSCSVAASSPIASIGSIVDSPAAQPPSHWKSNLWAFTKGAAIGFASGVVIIGAVAAIGVASPIAATVVTVGLVGAGVIGLVHVARHWSEMSSEEHWGFAGNVVGGIAAGGLEGSITRGVTGLLARGSAASAVSGAVAAPEAEVAAAAAEQAANFEETAIAARPKLTSDQIASILGESRAINADDAMIDAAMAAPVAQPMPELSFTGISSEALAPINDTSLLAGEALGHAPGANASSIWFKQGNPFYYEGITLVIPTERLAALGGEEGVGLAGQPGIMKVPFAKVPGGIPINEFAIVEALPHGYVKPLYVPPNWTGPVGPTLP